MSSGVKTYRVRGRFDPGLDLITTQEVVLARDYAALEAELAQMRAGQEPVASISRTNDDPEWKLKMLAEPAHSPVVPLKLYTSPQPSAEYVQVAEVMTGCLGKLNWLVMPNFKNGTKLYAEGGGDE